MVVADKKADLKPSRDFVRIIYALTIMGVIYAYPVVTCDRLYIDDLRRSVMGVAEWEGVGRPTASILMALLNFQYPFFEGLTIIDLSPLPQIISLALLIYSASRLSIDINKKTPFLLGAATVFPIIGSPFYLENISYQNKIKYKQII